MQWKGLVAQVLGHLKMWIWRVASRTASGGCRLQLGLQMGTAEVALSIKSCQISGQTSHHGNCAVFLLEKENQRHEKTKSSEDVIWCNYRRDQGFLCSFKKPHLRSSDHLPGLHWLWFVW